MKTRIVPASLLRHSLRFDGSYHNAEMNIYADLIESHPHNILSNLCSEIFTSGRNKRVYTSSEFGYPFLSNSDVVAADPLASCNYSSKKYGTDERAMLKGGMILTGRVGAIGQTAYVPKFWEKYKAMGSDNIIRIVPKDNAQGGYIYAYLTSKIGTLALWKLATGGVQPFITDSMVGSLPIPKFPEEFQKEVDSLVQESARLREEAAEALAEAKRLLDDFIDFPFKPTSGSKTAKRSLKDIRDSLQLRLDPPALINESVSAFELIKDRCKRLGDLQVKVWYPGMFKRAYVEPGKGLPYMQGSAVYETNPFRSCSYLSEKKTPKLHELWLTNGLILISCAGACGQIKLITKEYEEKRAIGSPDIVRLLSSDALFTQEYLFVYLQNQIVQDLIQSFKYGSVIERIDAMRVESIPVITPTEQLSKQITEIVKHYAHCIYRAFCKEETAVEMVEAEIEKWAK